MNKLQLKDQRGAPKRSPELYGKDRLIQDIKDFVGKDGYIPMTATDYNGIELRMSIGREKRRRIEYTEMDETMLMNVILELFRYQNYCHLYA